MLVCISVLYIGGSRGQSPSLNRVSPTIDQGIQVGPLPPQQRRTGNLHLLCIHACCFYPYYPVELGYDRFCKQ